jgi:hypothetical protein
MGSPAGVGDGDLLDEGLLLVDWGRIDEFLEPSNLANVLEHDYSARFVSVDTNTCGSQHVVHQPLPRTKHCQGPDAMASGKEAATHQRSHIHDIPV